MRIDYTKLRHGQICTENRQPIGEILDLIVEADQWDVRYIEVGLFQPKGQVDKTLISPLSVIGMEPQRPLLRTNLSLQQMDSCPPNPDWRTISRSYQKQLAEHFGWQSFWQDENQQEDVATEKPFPDTGNQETKTDLIHAAKMLQMRIESQNGPAGVMRDLLVDTNSWKISYASADPHTWLPRASSLFPTKWIKQLDWRGMTMQVDLNSASARHPFLSSGNIPLYDDLSANRRRNNGHRFA